MSDTSFSPEEIARLPKWAQHKLQCITQELYATSATLNVLHEPADYNTPGILFPTGPGISGYRRIRERNIRFVHEHGSFEAEFKPNGQLFICGHSRWGKDLIILPQAANALNVQFAGLT